MKKQFYANVEYNRAKRRNSVILCILLTICLLGTASIFLTTSGFVFGIIFLVPLILPFIALPSTFKSFPIDGKPMFEITDKEFVGRKVLLKIKEIKRVNVIITLPPSKLDSENKKTLEFMKSAKPDDTYLGDFDVVYNDETGKIKTLYSTIENPIDALKTMLGAGLKYYSIRYSIKKLSVKNEYDLKNEVDSEKQKEFSSATKKQKQRQIL